MNARRQRRQRVGFTLIEVMIAIGVLSIVVLGSTALGAVVQDEFFKYTLRQKAVFVLHGSMQRLVSSYQSQPWGWVPALDYQDTNQVITDFVTAADNVRRIPRVGGAGKLGTATAFATTDRQTFFDQPWLVFVVDDGVPGPSTDDRAYVWLDPDRGLIAAVSFAVTSPDNATAGAPAQARPNNLPTVGLNPRGCGNPVHSGATPDGCAVLIAYLEFPYFLPAPPSADPLGQLFPGYLETYTAATIVGPYMP